MGLQYATVHKTYGFSKDWQVHSAVTYFTPISQCIPITFRGLFDPPRSPDRGRVAVAHPSDGRRPHGPCVVCDGMVDFPGCAIEGRHHLNRLEKN